MSRIKTKFYENNSVTNTKLAQVSTQTIKGRTTAGTGDPEDLTATQATAILNNMVGDSGSGGTKGLVPAPSAGDAAASKFLKADGSWAVPASAISTSTKSADYTVVSGDNGGVILVDTSSSIITITLPTPVAGFNITIKDYKGNAVAYPITVKRASSSSKMDNAYGEDIINEAYEAVKYISDGTDWFRFSKYTGVSVSGRGIFQGGYNSSDVNTIDYISIDSIANATDFGDLSVTRSGVAGLGSALRGHAAGGSGPSNVIDYVVFMTLGNSTDFGDLSVARNVCAGAGSSTRGIIAGGSSSNVIDYITYNSAGNATDFGDLSFSKELSSSGANSPTRCAFAGGYNGGFSAVIDYITTASTGNASNFGNLTQARQGVTGGGSSTRGMFFGGETASIQNTVDYITLASTGDATDFGDLSTVRMLMGCACTETRAVTGGGFNASSHTTTMDYFTIASTGNATNFGDLTVSRRYVGGTSNSHGGLQ